VKLPPLRDALFRAVVLLGLIVLGVAFSLHRDDQSPSHQHEGSSEQGTEHVGPPKSFAAKTLEDPTAFFTATLAFLTFSLACVGVAQVYYLNRSDQTARISADAARKAAEVAERTLIASNRAWIKLTDIQISTDLVITDKGIDTLVSFKFTNTGNAPAEKIKFWIRMGLILEDHSHIAKFHLECDDIARYPPPGEAFLFPDESFPREGLLGIPIRIIRSKFDGAMFGYQGKDFVLPLILGCILYQFPSDKGRYHQTRFVLEIIPNTGFPVWTDPHRIAKDSMQLSVLNSGEGHYAD